MYDEFLRHAGLRPVVVSNATHALFFAPEADVIVTELLLPGDMDGGTCRAGGVRSVPCEAVSTGRSIA
jgi:hypothetical protein